MQAIITIILQVVAVLTGLGVFFAGGGYLYSRFIGGTKEQKAESVDLIASNDTIKQFYKEQNDDLKEINKALGEKVEVLTREVGEIRGQLNAETKQKADYLAILQNRNPEMQKFMEIMIQAVKDQTQVNINFAENQKEMINILSEIHKATTTTTKI